MANQTLSRRSFSKFLAAGAAYATLQSRAEVKASLRPRLTSSVVRLSSNENPYGPSPAALKAMTDGFSLAWRYPDEYADVLAEELARLHGVAVDQVLLGNGSGEILKLSAAAFTGREKKVVIANPTFEAIARHAGVTNAEVLKIDLTADYSHDLKKMLAAAGGAGLVYICNPNNPTASITSKTEMSDFLAKLSPATIVLVDEAYHHYVESKDYESVIPLVKQYVSWGAGPRAGQNLILGAKVRAVMNGRPIPSIEDVRAIAYPVLRHRIVTNFNADADGVSTDDLIDRLLEAVPA